MIIKKFLHSCLLVESEGKRLLIDPGDFCFIENKIKPEDLGPVDILLLTHEHSDHFFPEAIKKIIKVRQPRIITHQGLHDLLKQQGIESTVIKAGESMKIGEFSIEALRAPHGPLLYPAPENLGFIINRKIFHPGDSLEFSLKQPIAVFALPVEGPWLTLKEAVELAVRIKSKTVIPIHDEITKDFMLSRVYSVSRKRLDEAGIEFKPLLLGETHAIS